MTMTWQSALGWRLRRHFLGQKGAETVEAVVDRLVAVPAWLGDASTAIRIRLAPGADGDVDAAIAQGRIFGTFSFRGATHLMTPRTAAVHLPVRAAGRQWERKSWCAHYGLEPGDWPRLRATVRDALANGPLSQHELTEVLAQDPAYRPLTEALETSHTLFKALAWQGDLCFSPSDGPAVFRSFESIPGWQGLMELEDAGPAAVRAYLAAYGPATREQLDRWLLDGLSAGRRRLDGWVERMGDDIATLRIEGDAALCLAEHADSIADARASDLVVLLPRSDQWLIGTGTSDEHVVPAGHRALATRGAHPVLVGGRMSGTWRVTDSNVTVQWFDGERIASDARVDAAVERLSAALGRDLELTGK